MSGMTTGGTRSWCGFSNSAVRPGLNFAWRRRLYLLRSHCWTGWPVKALRLVDNAGYLAAARQAIPQGYSVANETPRPHFLTADFALIRDQAGELAPRLVEIQAFP